MLKLDENHDVQVDEAKNPKLAKVINEHVAPVAAKNEAIIHEHELMTEQGAQNQRLMIRANRIRGLLA